MDKIEERILRYIEVTGEELNKAKQENERWNPELLLIKQFVGHQDLRPVDITYRGFPKIFTIWFTVPYTPMVVDPPIPPETRFHQNMLMIYQAKSGFFWREPRMLFVGFLPNTHLIALIE